jgi:hypothetical protein
MVLSERSESKAHGPERPQGVEGLSRSLCKRQRKDKRGSHPENVVTSALEKKFNSRAFNALRPPAGAGIFRLPSRRIGQRWRATRAPRWGHTARAVFPWEDRLLVNLPEAQCDKRILYFPNDIRPRFWEESLKSEFRMMKSEKKTIGCGGTFVTASSLRHSIFLVRYSIFLFGLGRTTDLSARLARKE